MAIRTLSYLACDVCLEICDNSDADTGAEARHLGRRDGWAHRPDPRVPDKAKADVCLKCQADPARTAPG